MLISESLGGDLVAISVAILTVVVAYYKWTYQYWRRRNFPYLEPRIPFGNTDNPFSPKENAGIRVKRHYDMMRAKGWKHGGLYSLLKPSYLALDLECVKNIMTKDFQYFTDRGLYYNEKVDPLSAHLFAIGGQKWRNLRTKLSSTFTSGKMKMMFQTLVDCEPNLLQKIENDRVARVPIDIKEALGCFTTDIIGSVAFGLECNTFAEENSPFRKYGRKVFTLNTLRLLKITLISSFPNAAKNLGVVQTPKDVSKFFINLVKDTVSYRENNNYTRKDFLQLLIDLKNNKLAEDEGYKHDGNTLSIEEIAAQSFVFFIAGFETSSTTMTFALYEFSKHPELQDKVREEVNTVLAKHEGKITYDAIQEMKYMDQVINETLRKYPAVPLLTRKCVRDYKIPGEDLVIEKGTTILISILGIHYDKEYYSDPEKFDPERFTEENKKSRHHYAHLPFGEGPRMCIGMRFGLMQSKMGLSSLLKNYKFTVNKKTIEPLKMKVKSFIPTAEGEIWLDAEKI
jgi:cytochrome P450 family 6